MVQFQACSATVTFLDQAALQQLVHHTATHAAPASRRTRERQAISSRDNCRSINLRVTCPSNLPEQPHSGNSASAPDRHAQHCAHIHLAQVQRRLARAAAATAVAAGCGREGGRGCGGECRRGQQRRQCGQARQRRVPGVLRRKESCDLEATRFSEVPRLFGVSSRRRRWLRTRGRTRPQRGTPAEDSSAGSADRLASEASRASCRQ